MDTKLESNASKPIAEQNKHRELEPGPGSFDYIIRKLVAVNQPPNKQESKITNNNVNSNNSSSEIENNQDKRAGRQATSNSSTEQQLQQPQPNHHQQHQSAQQLSKRCRPPSSRKFGHPCNCNPPNSYPRSYLPTNSSLPAAAPATPLHLYDTVTKKCYPTSRSRDMLLRDCHPNSFPVKQHHTAPCFYDDLICDSRRFRCVCKPSLHLYYESNHSFACVPIGPNSSADGRINCRPGYIYNVIAKDCQKIFDVNELPQTPGVSATQFSFVTIVLIWILLLILIVTAKLRKLRTSNLYRNSPPADRRHPLSYRHQSHNASAWLHPFIAAVNGHHQFNQHHRTTADRHSQGASDESGNYNDTDFFLSSGGLRRINDMLSDPQNFSGSQQSLNNPPPKFEEIYPTCNEEVDGNDVARPPPPSPYVQTSEDLPSYDEAMKLENTTRIQAERTDYHG